MRCAASGRAALPARLALAGLASLALLSATGCSGLCTPECSAGYACRSGQCVPASTTCTPQCRSGYTCRSGVCIIGESDVCQGVSTNGSCLSSTELQICASATGDGTPSVFTYSCPTGQECRIQSGTATCALTADCSGEETRCSGASALQTCNSGRWIESTCPNGCLSTALGSACNTSTGGGSMVNLSGRVVFQYRKPNADLTDWSTSVSLAPAVGMIVLSRNASGELYDAQYTGLSNENLGQFTVKVPQSPTSNDSIVVLAAAADDQNGLAFAIANPDLSAGTHQALPNAAGPQAQYWSWAWPTSGLSNGQDLTITEAMGSGAANVYFNMVVAYIKTLSYFNKKPGPPVVTWVGYGVRWSCGACFAPWPTTLRGIPFASQIYIGADSDQAYWSDAVASHELGHWAMQFYGTSPREGGTHYFGVPTFPGQAWSEGWATWFSSDMRQDPIYYDKQGGGFLWFDVSKRLYDNGNAFKRPSASSYDGLLQPLDENEVAAMLLALSSASGAQALYSALASPRANTAPFQREYTRHTWTTNQTGPNNIVDTGESVPMLADFLDALDCAGFARSTIDAAMQPAIYYPYASNSPICP
jgi:hypothetical protein